MKWFQNVLVGVLFFGALAVVGYFTILSESGPFAQKGEQMVLFFENGDGIKIGSKVTVLGVPNGSVTNVELVAIDEKSKPVKNDSPQRVGQKVAITIEVKQPIVFYENYKVAIKSSSLLSDKMIAIDPGSALDYKTRKKFKSIKIASFDTTRLKTMREKGVTPLTEVLNQRRDIPGAELKAAAYTDLEGQTSGDPIAGISQLIEENRANVRATINNVAEITTKINRGRGTVGQLINDDELHRNANTLLTDAQVVIKELRESLEDTREQAPVTSFIRAVLTAF